MKVTLDKGGADELVLADGVSAYRKVGGRNIQTAQYVADTADDAALDNSFKEFFDLGNKSVDISFRGSLGHADCDAAIAYLLTSDALYVSDKTLTFENPDGDSWELEFGVLKGWDESYKGSRTYHQFSVVGARLVDPDAADADAQAAIDAITAAGATLSSAQEGAIDTWVKAGKADGWWALYHRLFLPVHGVAAANAIDLAHPATSGTFSGGVTHAAGYVQGDGISGSFDTASSPASNGMSLSSLSLAYASPQSAASTIDVLIGSSDAAVTTQLSLWANHIFRCLYPEQLGASSETTFDGVFLATRNGAAMETARRVASATSIIGSGTISVSAGPLPSPAITAMSRGGVDHSSHRLSLIGIAHTGHSSTQRDSFLAATETLLGNWPGAL